MPTLQLICGFILLIAGADVLVRGGSALALRLGLSPLTVGLTVVAFGTSTPELIVSIRAALTGVGDIAVGNVVGSNICNIALIIGLTALIRPLRVEAKLLRVDVPLVLAVTLLVSGMLLDGKLGRLAGAALVVGLGIYLVLGFRSARVVATPLEETIPHHIPMRRPRLPLAVLMALLGLIGLSAGADLFVEGAIAMARRFGVGEAVIGLTLVALGTSLPELATSIVAALRGEGDIALGNVVGSNLFNLLAVLGISATIAPIQAQGVDIVDLAVMVGLTALLIPVARTGFQVNRVEGALLLVIYGSYMGYLIR